MRLNKFLFFAISFARQRNLLRRVNLCLSIFLVLLLTPNIQAQTYNFAWIGDTGIGVPGAEAKLDSVVQFINDSTDVKFVLFTGNFSDFSDTDDFESVNSIIRKLKIPYHVIPGSNDVQWSGNRNDFIYTFDNDRFSFEFEDEIFIGLSSAIHWCGDGGHIYPEDLAWLKEQLNDLRINKKIYLVISNPLNESTDNWFKITNLLKDYNIQAIFCGGGKENKLLNINQIPGLTNKPLFSNEKKEWSFTLINNSPDSLIIYDVDKKNIPTRWMSVTKNINPEIVQIDSSQFNGFDNEIILNIELNSTLIAPPVYNDGKIYTADYLGLITCYDTTGNVLWDYDSYGNIASKPKIADNIFVAATLQGDLITLNASTGEQIQTIGFDDEITSALITIEFAGKQNLLLPKFTQSKAAVVLGTSTGKLYCYDLETLQEYWVNTSAKGRIITEPLHVGNKIIYGSWDGYLYCIDAREGWLIWKWSASKDIKLSPAGCQPVTDGKKIFITTPDSKLYAIDLQLGKTAWQSNKFNCWESIGFNNNRNRVLLKNYDGKFNIIETKRGRNRKTIHIDYANDKTPTSPVAWEGNILVPAGNGHIYKIDKKFKVSELLFMGTAAINTFQHITENVFLASNIDGRVTLFKIN